jgi:hypothetical protein
MPLLNHAIGAAAELAARRKEENYPGISNNFLFQPSAFEILDSFY